MDNMPNRKQRRELARKAGFLKMKGDMPLSKKREMSARAAEFGRQIHLSNTERILREDDEKQRLLDQKRLLDIMSKGNTQEEALKIFNKEKDSNNI